ncbi:Leucine-rich repeat-containing protein 15 [Holothuria leucospilota]|uniref:Leucine-rich repeat-containing protein 15 n=1 Tax=Holothuria leucospilota TaxID=206669 RepID=A0A9Q1HL79_HOLLE|nr:Leucine-rich repeat-containing protein 15 [Holothuria leucospilota]
MSSITLFFIYLINQIFTSCQSCITRFDVYDECEHHLSLGCCTLGTAFVCSGVNVTNADNFADEIPQTCASLTIANTNKSFINDGDWKFLYNLTNLEQMSFNNHKISNLGNLKSIYLKDLVQLKLLSLSHGNLRIFPVEKFTNLLSLKYLSLNCNKLQSIGEGRWNFSLLIDLILSNNRITAVRAEQLKGLETLSKLDLSYNRISYFSSKVLDSMPNLRYLLLLSNRLVHVSDRGQQHTKLIFWGTSSNLFVSLKPFIFNGLKSLRTIDYSRNRIKEPPTVNSTNYVIPILFLSLQFNLIELLSPLFFDHFPELKGINVASNRIRHIEENTFRSVSNLTSIAMHGNQIQTIPQQLFQHLEILDIIELQHNRIQIIHPRVLHSLTTDVQLFIHHNPIVCDCQAISLIQWLSRSAVSRVYFPTCQSPVKLQNRSLYNVQLPESCPNSTLMPASTDVTPTSYRNPPMDQSTFIFIMAAFILVSACVLCVYALYVTHK